MNERRSFPPAPSTPSALVLTAHPFADGFVRALGAAWAEGAEEAGAVVDQIDVHDLDFEPRLRSAYRSDQALETDLEDLRDRIAGAAHLTVSTPTWWSSVPAGLKGAFDRVLLPGWAFRYENGLPVPGLSGRSARLIMTMDAPLWYDTIFNHRASRRQVERGVLGFCGFSVKTRAFGSVGTSSEEQRAKMLARARADGLRDGAALVARMVSAA
jgi:NAD(P)H dehydrogenase (quinone)